MVPGTEVQQGATLISSLGCTAHSRQTGTSAGKVSSSEMLVGEKILPLRFFAPVARLNLFHLQSFFKDAALQPTTPSPARFPEGEKWQGQSTSSARSASSSAPTGVPATCPSPVNIYFKVLVSNLSVGSVSGS